MSRALRVTLLFFAATLLAQAAWILAVPPFRGIDEFEHVYRAASVAHGQWGPVTEISDDRRGGMVAVPVDVVEAAQAQCEALKYTSDQSCRPTARAGSGLVEVESAAYTQSPVLYGFLGSVAKPFPGAQADYAMRIAVALLCAPLLAGAAWSLSQWSRTIWPLMSLLTVVTPVVVYSSVIPAGNGPEMVAAIALWCALLGLATGEVGIQRRLLLVAIPSAVTLVSLRQMGPLFFILIGCVVMLVLGADGIRRVLHTHRWLVLGGAVAVAVAAVGQVGWILRAGTGEPLSVSSLGGYPLLRLFSDSVLWVLQAVGTGVYRNQAAPTPVYPLVLLVSGALVVAALTVTGSKRLRGALGLAVLLSVVVPAAFAIRTYPQLGSFWQGRYGLALTAGVVLLAGFVLDRSTDRAPAPRGLVVIGIGMLAVAHLLSTSRVLAEERVRPVSVSDPHWVMPSMGTLVVLVATSWVLQALAVRAMARGPALVTAP